MVSPVYTYVPNIIGYSRVILTILSFVFVWDDYRLFFLCYSTSAFLDMADGHAARLLGQCSKFGAVLDMVTDRASTLCLIIVLSHLYPQRLYVYGFIAVCALDLVSHFARLYSQLSAGVGHKVVKPTHSAILKIYYGNRYMLAFMCAGNEGFWVFLYLLHFIQHPIVYAVLYFCAPICFMKQYINVIQLMGACSDIVDLDDADAKNQKNNNRKKN
eukprot:TRINITY_DN1048_c0_g1_i1.p1 TRINITY_DN1048_c0_g1~~TRINITY_DN1048_c0_g1_i1.p1  ORF type:complete len:215 (+),score=32.94 TRINITY_DN1048_c0_g1_i1:104-748(+)